MATSVNSHLDCQGQIAVQRTRIDALEKQVDKQDERMNRFEKYFIGLISTALVQIAILAFQMVKK